jgi:phospholipid/cholesterol/gamma-HCH transport system permease protein
VDSHAEHAAASLVPDADRMRLQLSGTWNRGGRVPHFSDLDLAPLGVSGTKLILEAPDLGNWDSSLLVFLSKAADYCSAQGISLDTDGLPRNLRHLLHLATAVPETKDARSKRRNDNVLEWVGRETLFGWKAMLDVLDFTGRCVVSFGALLIGKAKVRWRDFMSVIQECGPDALPIVALISFLVGLIITFLGATVLQRMGAEIYVPYIVGFGILREMGVLMVAIIMAGRTGASFAAKIGSMKVSEEIDALTTLGISPMDFLVLPRVLAMILMMPLLTLFADAIGIAAGYLISSSLFEISATQFASRITESAGVGDMVVGLVKSVIFGIVIAFSGCLRGMQCGSGSDAVGMAATSAVVTSITYIVITNALVDWISIIYGF